jgi:hypothetical protein
MCQDLGEQQGEQLAGEQDDVQVVGQKRGRTRGEFTQDLISESGECNDYTKEHKKPSECVNFKPTNKAKDDWGKEINPADYEDQEISCRNAFTNGEPISTELPQGDPD